jgi:hypothetical protein
MAEKRMIDNPWISGILGGLTGVLIGEIANASHAECTPQEKRKWADNRIMHHGEFGVYTAIVGAASKSPFLTGIGLGLVISDLDDKDEWFKPKPIK